MSEVKQKHIAEADAIAAKAQADAKIEAQKQRAEELKKFAHRVKTMSHQQLRGELRRTIRNEKGAPGLTAAIAAVSLIVLESTKTKENPEGKVHAYPR